MSIGQFFYVYITWTRHCTTVMLYVSSNVGTTTCRWTHSICPKALHSPINIPPPQTTHISLSKTIPHTCMHTCTYNVYTQAIKRFGIIIMCKTTHVHDVQYIPSLAILFPDRSRWSSWEHLLRPCMEASLFLERSKKLRPGPTPTKSTCSRKFDCRNR